MNAYIKVIASFAAVVLVVLVYFIYRSLNANDLEKRLAETEPIGVRLALQEETGETSLEIVAQMVLYPEHDRVLFYFLNTDAQFDEDDDPISGESPRSADRFSRFTGVDSDYSVTISRHNLVRLLNLAGGLDYFLEDVVVLEGALFQYPRGVQFWPGDQIVEYALGRTPTEPERAHLSGVERLLRIESVLLNFFWKKEAYLEKFAGEEIWGAAFALFDTDLSSGEARSLLEFIARKKVHSSVLEVPLEAVNAERRRGKKLLVKDQRAKLLYNGFHDNMVAGRLNSDQFSMEVLNGTEISRLANRVQQYLKDRGTQVLDADNYPYKPVLSTVVLERSGNSYSARKLLEMTGMKAERVFFSRQVTDVDLSMVLGEDFDIKKFFK